MNQYIPYFFVKMKNRIKRPFHWYIIYMNRTKRMLSGSYSIYQWKEVLDMLEKKAPTQRDIDKIAESIFAASADKERDAERQAKKLDITASFIRSKLAIQ